MAIIQPRRNKSGQVISYRIRVYHGSDAYGKRLKPYEKTFKPAPGMTEKQAEKAVAKEAALFEEQCKHGVVSNNKQTFAQYADYVLQMKRSAGLKDTTYYRYLDLLKRINAGIGHIKITELRPQHLNAFYAQLAQQGQRNTPGKATARCDLKAVVKQSGSTQEAFIHAAGISLQTFYSACRGASITVEKAQQIAQALGSPLHDLFTIEQDNRPLSAKTVLEHHRLIHSVLRQAEKEMIILFNPAARVMLPKQSRPEVKYMELEEVKQILACLQHEPIKWQAFIHLLIITGCRRGEVAALTWDDIDFKGGRIYVHSNLVYLSATGIYTDTPKTETSKRVISVPPETLQLLKSYRKWQNAEIIKSGDRWTRTGYLFCKEDGTPMHPQSVNIYLNKFAARYGFDHINPHAFRHTAASILNAQGVDIATISRRLGHSKVSTTEDIYTHMLRGADRQAADSMASAVFGTSDKKEQA